MYFWCGVSAIAGALRRRVWIDQISFQWYPNLYIVLVAPPGIVSKSTTADTAMSLLREVPGIQFGPSVVTWQALVTSFAGAAETFTVGNVTHTMSPMTINSSEFGNLLDPRNKELVDMLVHLWDGKPFVKATKGSGVDDVINPWINIIAATTPDWIAGSFPEYMVGGGFTSRCLFVYAEEKAKYVAWPALAAPSDIARTQADLIHDLEHIAVNLAGEYKLSNDALTWGAEWYERHYKVDSKTMDGSRFGGYIARKQTLACKVAMVLAASRRDELVIEQEDLATATDMLTDLEPDMDKVFAKIGMTQEAVHSDRLTALIKQRGRMPLGEVYAWMKRYFPHKTHIEDVLAAGYGAGHYHVESESAVGPHYIVAGVVKQQRPLAAVVPLTKTS
jgi:hypothetical protein